ncbi:MAG: phage portal protein, partial [Oscillospiraceae bacterium]
IQPAGNTVRLWMLPSEQISVWWDNAKILADTPQIWYRWSAPNGKRYIYSGEEILHFRTWLSFDGISGLAVRDILKLTLDGSISSQKMLNRMYENGMTGKTALQYTGDLNDDKEKIFTANMEHYIDGKVDGVKSLIPIPAGTALVPLNVKLADSQFLELRKYTALQVAAAFGVKPDQINDYEKSSYSSSEAQQIAFLVDTLLWIVENYEQEISYKLLTKEERAAGFAAKFNTGVILRTTTDKQIESLAKGVANSIYKPNEARNHLDMCHAPGGDRLYAGNGSVIPIEMAGAQYGTKGGKKDEQ